MRCNGKPEKISLFIDDMLDARQQKAMVEHLKECETCSGIRDDYEMIRCMLKKSYGEKDKSEPDMAYDVMARLYGGRKTFRRTLIAASMVILLAGGFFLGSYAGKPMVASNEDILRDVLESENMRKAGYIESNVENIRVRYEEVGF